MVSVLTCSWPTDMHNVGFAMGFLLVIVFLTGVFKIYFGDFLEKLGHIYDFNEINI